MKSLYRCETCNKYKWNGCIALSKDTSLIDIVGCASHSDFNRPRGYHDVEKFYRDEPVCFKNPKECQYPYDAADSCEWFIECVMETNYGIKNNK